MALTARQTRLYVHTVNLYKPLDIKLDARGEARDARYPGTPTAAAVKCYKEPRVEATEPQVIGRTNVDNIFTIEKFHFDAAQEISGEWVIEFVTDGHPDDGQFFLVQGESMVSTYRANKQSVTAIHITKPSGIP